MKMQRLYSMTGVMITGLSASIGWAQETATLEEVIVTANKRTVSMQDVAVSMSALNESSLDALGITNFEDYARSITGLNYTNSGPNKNNIIVRGVADGAPNGDYQVQSTVAIYLDDTPLTSSVANPDLHVFDIERIELLRGPQGTLYGAGAVGGALKLISNKPKPGEWEGKLDATYSSIKDGDASYALNGAINIPVGENSALRAMAYTKEDGGYIDNTTLGIKDWNTVETTGGRLGFRSFIGDNLDITLSYTHQEVEVDGKNWYEPELGDLQYAGALPEQQDDTVDLGSMLINYDAGFAQFVSATSYYEGKNDHLLDWSAIGFSLLEPLFVGSRTEPIVGQHLDQEYSVFAQEFRLVSVDTSAFNWTVGLFYSDEETTLDQVVTVDQLDRLMALTPLGPGSVQPGGPLYVGDDAIFTNQVLSEVEQLALFGEASYDFSARWTATAGFRYFEADTSNQATSTGAQNVLTGVASTAAIERLIQQGIAPTPPAIAAEVFSSQGLVANPAATADDDGVNPRFGLEFRPSDDVLTYATAAKGYRLGGANTGLVTTQGAPATYDSDEMWSYEIGVKSTLAGGAATINAAIYYLEWDDIISLGALNGFRYRTNAGEASVTGAELDAALILSERWLVTAGISYADSQLDENFCSNPLANEPCEDDSPQLVGAEGDALIGVPEITFNASARYQRPLTAGLDLQMLASYQYVGEAYTRYESGPGALEIGDYEVLNLRLGVLSSQGWEATLFGHNLTDDRGLVNALEVEGNISDRYYLYNAIIRPLSVGVNLRYTF